MLYMLMFLMSAADMNCNFPHETSSELSSFHEELKTRVMLVASSRLIPFQMEFPSPCVFPVVPIPVLTPHRIVALVCFLLT